MNMQRVARGFAAVFGIMSASACSQAGQLGEILGSVLGGGGGQVAGTVRGVDTRSQQLSLQQSNGQTVALAFDNQTRVVYQSRVYSVTSLENGDQVNARVQQLQDGSYYTDSVQVTQPIAGSGSTTGSVGNETVQLVRGTVGQIDRTNGLFTLNMSSNVVVTVSLPYNTSSADRTRFQNLRVGDSIQLYGVYISNTRVELRQFN